MRLAIMEPPRDILHKTDDRKIQRVVNNGKRSCERIRSRTAVVVAVVVETAGATKTTLATVPSPRSVCKSMRTFGSCPLERKDRWLEWSFP